MPRPTDFTTVPSATTRQGALLPTHSVTAYTSSLSPALENALVVVLTNDSSTLCVTPATLSVTGPKFAHANPTGTMAVYDPLIQPSSHHLISTCTHIGNTCLPQAAAAPDNRKHPPTVATTVPSVTDSGDVIVYSKSPTKRRGDSLSKLKQKHKKVQRSSQPLAAALTTSSTFTMSQDVTNLETGRFIKQRGKKGKAPAKVSAVSKIHSPSQKRHKDSKYTKSRGFPAETDDESKYVLQGSDADVIATTHVNAITFDETIDFYYDDEVDSI